MDLFPETLLVARTGARIYTTSRKVAEHFHKRHDNVMRDIQKVIADAACMGVSLLNFEESTYRNSRGKAYPQYTLDRKAFSILAGRLTGKQALRWQIDFYDAFEAMETDLADLQARYVAALDVLRPHLRPVVQDFEGGLPRSDTALWLGKSAAAVTYHRGQARRLGLLPARAACRVVRDGGESVRAVVDARAGAVPTPQDTGAAA